MTGPEHYAESERLIALIDSEQNAIPEQRIAHAALAQVHATLAQAAATVDAAAGGAWEPWINTSEMAPRGVLR